MSQCSDLNKNSPIGVHVFKCLVTLKRIKRCGLGSGCGFAGGSVLLGVNIEISKAFARPRIAPALSLTLRACVWACARACVIGKE